MKLSLLSLLILDMVKEEKKNYKINYIYQLKNGNFVSCNSFGIKIYSKENDKYVLKSKKYKNDRFKNTIEIELN